MANAFDPYREALVVEESTIWPEEYDAWEPEDRRRIEQYLHSKPQQAADLDYVRLHTGFCRQITVTEGDLAKIK